MRSAYESQQIVISILLSTVLISACIKNEEKGNENVLFDAVSLLGKKPAEIDGVFGTPYLIQSGSSKSDSSLKSHWRWYHFQKGLAVFIDQDSADSIAKSITLIFATDPTDAVEAASRIGIDLTGKRPTSSGWGTRWKDEKYENIRVSGQKITVYFFKDDKSEDTLKIYFDDQDA